MMRKLERDQLAADLAALDSLLATAPASDVLGRIGLEARREEVRRRFDELAEVAERRARVALYFGGEPVIGSMGIEAGFGSNALGTFQDLLSKVWGTAEGGQVAAMGPIKDKEASQLHITHLVHGSFGFLLEELDEEGEPLFETPLNKAAARAVEYIASLAGEDEARYAALIEIINPRVFQSLKGFLGHVYRAKATLRLVEGERDERLNRDAVERAWHRVDESDVDEDRVEVEGRLLGVIPVRGRFEFEPDGAQKIITGKVGEQFTQSYLERINTEQFAGRRWKAVFTRRVVTRVGRPPAEAYTLVELDEIEHQQQ